MHAFTKQFGKNQIGHTEQWQIYTGEEERKDLKKKKLEKKYKNTGIEIVINTDLLLRVLTKNFPIWIVNWHYLDL